MAPTLMMVVVSGGNTGLSLCPTTNGPVSQFIQHLFQLSLGVISGVLEWTIDYHNQLRADKWTVDTLLPLHTTTSAHCLYLSAKYPIFNQHQLPSRRAQAH